MLGLGRAVSFAAMSSAVLACATGEGIVATMTEVEWSPSIAGPVTRAPSAPRGAYAVPHVIRSDTATPLS